MIPVLRFPTLVLLLELWPPLLSLFLFFICRFGSSEELGVGGMCSHPVALWWLFPVGLRSHTPALPWSGGTLVTGEPCHCRQAGVRFGRFQWVWGFTIRLSPSLSGSHAGCPVVDCVWHSCDLPTLPGTGCVWFMHFFGLCPQSVIFFSIGNNYFCSRSIRFC